MLPLPEEKCGYHCRKKLIAIPTGYGMSLNGPCLQHFYICATEAQNTPLLVVYLVYYLRCDKLVESFRSIQVNCDDLTKPQNPTNYKSFGAFPSYSVVHLKLIGSVKHSTTFMLQYLCAFISEPSIKMRIQ